MVPQAQEYSRADGLNLIGYEVLLDVVRIQEAFLDDPPLPFIYIIKSQFAVVLAIEPKSLNNPGKGAIQNRLGHDHLSTIIDICFIPEIHAQNTPATASNALRCFHRDMARK